MILATENSIKAESCTLYELKCFIKHVKLSAQHVNIQLSWEFKDGVYWAYMKRDGQTLYKKPYTKFTLLDVIIQMHLDFKEVMESTALKKV